MLALVEGGIEYLNTLATVYDEPSRKRMVKLFKEARAELKGRLVVEAGHNALARTARIVSRSTQPEVGRRYRGASGTRTYSHSPQETSAHPRPWNVLRNLSFRGASSRRRRNLVVGGLR